MDKMRMESADIAANNVEKIEQLFPECITEAEDENGKLKKVVDFDKLKQALSKDIIDDEAERYEFTWAGKRKARAKVNKSIRKTLRPCKEESKNWGSTENLYIEGDNLDVLKLLQESYMGKVKMIYIDPPYNTGSDFIYKDDFSQSVEEYEQATGTFDEENNRLVKNTETNGRFHSDWCSMIYPRLMLARNLLSDNGVIFISIDDNELENLKKICNEVFGEKNFITQIIWQSTAGSNTGTDIVTVTESIYVYTKNRLVFTFDGKIVSETRYILSDEYEKIRGKYVLDKLDRRRVAGHYSSSLDYPLEMPDGTLRYPGGDNKQSTEGWNYLWSASKVKWGIENGFIVFKQNNGQWNVYNKRYARVDNDGKFIERTIPFRNLITSELCNTAQGTAEIRGLFPFRVFDFPKPTTIIKQLFLSTVRTDKEALILDFFSGSATTAHAVMQLNAEDGGKRKFIMVQLPEKTDKKSEAFKAGYKNICEIGKERIRRAGDRIKEEAGLSGENLDIGFRVFKLDSTNMNDIYYSADEYSQDTVERMESNIKEDRTDLDLLFGCLLDWGLPLSLPYTSEQIDGFAVHTYNKGDLIACFAENISEKVIEEIARRRPLRAVFRDSGFMDSSAKINVWEKFKLLAPDTQVKVI